MPVKINDATLNRPEGNRLIDAPAVRVNIDDVIEQLKNEPAWDKNDRNGITVFKGAGLSMVVSAFRKGAEIKDLQLEGLLVLQVITGTVSVVKAEETLTIGANQLLVLHSSEEHQMISEEETILLLSAVKDGSKI